MTQPNDLRALVRDAIARLEADYIRVADAVDHTDPAEAFPVISEWSATLRKLHDQTAELRARCASRVYAAEQMSLQVLANRIGVSKARADQLLRQAHEKGEPS